MSKHGFLDILEEVLDQDFPYDYEINWDKRNHTVEISFLLQAENRLGVETVDAVGQTSTEDIVFEESLLLYNPSKSRFHADDYLAALPYLPKKGFSREFISYLVDFLRQTADQGLDELMDFLEDPEAQEFAIAWDGQTFEKGRAELVEGEFYPYPRY